MQPQSTTAAAELQHYFDSGKHGHAYVVTGLVLEHLPSVEYLNSCGRIWENISPCVFNEPLGLRPGLESSKRTDT